MRINYLFAVLITITLLEGCAGNQIKWSDVSKIKSGMSAEEVTQLLGEPNGIYSRDGKLLYTWSSVSLATGSRGVRIEFKDNKVTDAPAVPNSFKD